MALAESKAPGRPELLVCLHERATEVRNAFESWRIHSVFLSAVFVPWMFYYWSLEDTRYNMSNLIFQIIWGVTWWFVSAPTLHAARAFESYRSELVVHLIQQGEHDTELVAAVRAESPVSFASAVTSGLAVGATYLVPFLNKLLS